MGPTPEPSDLMRRPCEDTQGEGHMTTEAETRMTCLHTKGRQGWPAATKSSKRQGLSPRVLGGTGALPTP